jgi:hypothetical protein
MSDAILGRVRASSWIELFDCSYRWYWKNIQGVRKPIGGFAMVGTGVHKGTEVFDRARLEQRPASIEEATQHAVDAIDNPKDEDGSAREVEYDNEDMSKGEAKDFAVQLTAKYCRELAPAMQYSDIEIKIKNLNVTTSYGALQVSGTIDRVRIHNDGPPGITDFKTGGTAVGTDGVANTKGHHLQLGIYTVITEIDRNMKLGAATVVGFQTNSKLRVGTGTVERPKRALVGNTETPGLIEVAAKMLKDGVFPPNPKSMLCSRKWCPAYDLCIYHE